jgi:hypothetical protein
MRKGTMKKYNTLGLVLALILCLGSFASGETGPKIKFREDSIDFGKIKQGEALTHIFVFHNVGEDTLKIKRVQSSCGCTAALVSKREIAPGEKGEVRVTFNSRGFRGKVNKYIYVDTNEPTQSTKKLSVSANIEVPPQPSISLDRYSADVGLFLEGEEMKTKTVISNKGQLELRVNCSHKDATFFSEGKEISFPLKIPAGKSREVEIRIPPRKRKGVVREYIMIKSNDPNRQNLSFFHSGYIITKEQLKELLAKYKDVLD